MSKKSKEKVRVGISIGDINGIGMEVIIKTFRDNRILQNCIPVIYGSSRIASYHRKAIGVEDFNFHLIDRAEDAQNKKANLVNLWEEEVDMTLGKSTATAGKYAVKSLEAAADDLATGKIDVLVTAPFNKNNIQSSEFKFPGHTEYLADKAGTTDYLMLMVDDSLKIGTVTGHIPLKDVASTLSTDLILKKLQVLNKSLITDFGISRPKIAVLGLNPHAGDGGTIGDEEPRIISPAVKKARAENMLVFGPYSADGFFGSGNFKQFDGVLAMYHDQGLIPFKTMAFGGGVNFTAGLPIVRTSPDHGTAYDIAGKNIADESSFRQAIYLACDVFLQRKLHKELTSNPLKTSKLEKEE